MNVRQIIDNAITLCGLGDNPDSVEKDKIYLRYLNIIHRDIFKFIIDVHPSLELETKEVNITNGESEDDVSSFPLINKVMTANNRLLEKKSLNNIMANDPLRKQIGDPYCYYLLNNKICVYPKWDVEKQPLFIMVVKEPSDLELSSSEEDIPYPSIYHDVLLNGLCTRISLDELGDRMSNRESKVFHNDYEKGKMELHAYLANKYGSSSYSTYSWI